jgi:formylglycine-generating enzyme required for sulfatase activity
VNENKYFDTRNLGWKGKSPELDKALLPVRGVTYFEALDYCKWLSIKTGRTYRLPTELEWEKTARGNDGRVYPWGNNWEENQCNAGNDSPSEVDKYPQGIYGCYDLIGNVPEWTCSLWGSDDHKPDEVYQYPRDNTDPDDGNRRKFTRRVIRGGSYQSNKEDLRCSARQRDLPTERGYNDTRYGFRVVLELD